MAQFRKRPVVVEAEQWWPNSEIKGVQYEQEYTKADLDGERIIREGAYVTTIHGERAHLAPGDYVITEPDGIHHYPCKPDIFEATYDPADESMTASPGPAYADIAASAYRAYAASTGNKNYQGNPMPTWDQLSQAIQTAWEAAIRQALNLNDGAATHPSIWAGWVPPQFYTGIPTE
jgi:hypothetical protein